MHRRRPVDTRQCAEIIGRRARTADRKVSAHIGKRADLESEEFAVLVEGERHVTDIVAPVAVRHEAFRPVAAPFHRPPGQT